MAARKRDIVTAITQVRNLIERLNARVGAADEDAEDFAHAFYDRALGNVVLSRAEGRDFAACIAALSALHGTNPEVRDLSEKATEDLLRLTVLRALRPKKPKPARDAFERRLGRELARLRRSLFAPSRVWTVSIAVSGISANAIPATFGGVRFVPATKDAAFGLSEVAAEYAPTRRRSARVMRAQAEIRRRLRERAAAVFEAHDAIASVDVSAIDPEAAWRNALERVRRVVDVLNFFAPLIHDLPLVHRAYVSPDAAGSEPGYFVRERDGDAVSTSSPLAAPSI